MQMVTHFEFIVNHTKAPLKEKGPVPKFHFEWPKNSDGWKQLEVEKLQKVLTNEVLFDGCSYNLVDKKEHR